MVAAAEAENSMHACAGWDWLREIARRDDWELLGMSMKARRAVHLASRH